MDYLRLKGVETVLHWDVKDELDAELCLEVYELFEAIVERHMRDLSAIAVHLENEDGSLTWTVVIRAVHPVSLVDTMPVTTGLTIEETGTDTGMKWQISPKGGAR